MIMIKLITVIFLCFFLANPAFAYLGPGMGGGIIAATIGIVVAIFAALFGLIWFPIKRLLKKRKDRKENKENKSD